MNLFVDGGSDQWVVDGQNAIDKADTYLAKIYVVATIDKVVACCSRSKDISGFQGFDSPEIW